MLPETHIKIAKEAANRLRLNENETSLLMSGLVRPLGFIAPARSTYRVEETILYNVYGAKALYLREDERVFGMLGEVFHLISEGWTFKPGRRGRQSEWEVEINNSKFKEDPQFLREIKDSTMSPTDKDFYEKLLASIKELMLERDFVSKPPAIMSLINPKMIEYFHAEWIEEVLRYRAPWCFMLKTAYYSPYDDFYPCVSPTELIPFPPISYIIFASEYRRMNVYESAPSIDLNFALRICLIIGSFILSERGSIIFPQKILSWDNVSFNWYESMDRYAKKCIKKHVIQKMRDKNWARKLNESKNDPWKAEIIKEILNVKS